MSPPRFALTTSTLVDGTGAPPVASAGVIVADGVITMVDTAERVRTAAAQAGVTLHDTEHAATTLIPGLIDAHVHLGWGYDGIATWDPAAAPEQRLVYMAAAAQAVVSAGVTTIRDCGCVGFESLHLRDAVRRGVIAGPDVVACGPCITTTGGHGDFIGVTADSADELRTRVRELVAAGVDAIKIMVTGGSMDPQTNPRRAQYSAAELAPAVADAHRLGRLVVAHCNATEGIRNAIEAGVDTIAHCNWLGASPGTIDYQSVIAEMIVAQGTSIDLNIAATIRPLADGDGHAQLWDGWAPGNRWELHGKLRQAGAAIFLSSDEFGPHAARFPALLARAISELGIDPAEAIHRSTMVPATAIGTVDAGTVVAGRRADLVLLDGRLDETADALTRPIAVWRNGDPVLRRQPASTADHAGTGSGSE